MPVAFTRSSASAASDIAPTALLLTFLIGGTSACPEIRNGGPVYLQTSVGPPSPPLSVGGTSDIVLRPQYRASTSATFSGLRSADLLPFQDSGRRVSLVVRETATSRVVFDGEAVPPSSSSTEFVASVTFAAAGEYTFEATWQVIIETVGLCVSEWYPHTHLDSTRTSVPDTVSWTARNVALPSPPPAAPPPLPFSPPPPNAPPLYEHFVTLSFISAGTVEDYPAWRLRSIAEDLASEIRRLCQGNLTLSANNVTLAVSPASVLVNATIRTESPLATTKVALAIADLLTSASTFETALNLTLAGDGSAAVHGSSRLISASPPPPSLPSPPSAPPPYYAPFPPWATSPPCPPYNEALDPADGRRLGHPGLACGQLAAARSEEEDAGLVAGAVCAGVAGLCALSLLARTLRRRRGCRTDDTVGGLRTKRALRSGGGSSSSSSSNRVAEHSSISSGTRPKAHAASAAHDMKPPPDDLRASTSSAAGNAGGEKDGGADKVALTHVLTLEGMNCTGYVREESKEGRVRGRVG